MRPRGRLASANMTIDAAGVCSLVPVGLIVLVTPKSIPKPWASVNSTVVTIEERGLRLPARVDAYCGARVSLGIVEH